MMELRSKALTCLVTLPDSVVQAVEVDRNSEGREVLLKVCENLNILEVDYFGLIHYGNKGEELWLNLRNRVTAELCGSPPYRLGLCVKFFVEPHFIQQDETRNQFFLNVKQHFLNGKIKFESEDDVMQLAAILLHMHRCDRKKPSDISASDPVMGQFLPPGYQSDVYKNCILDQCAKLGQLSQERARNRFLKVASSSQYFGMHFHDAKDELGKLFHIGVCRNGIVQYGEQWNLIRSLSWAALQSATHNALNVILNTVVDDGSTVSQSLRLANKTTANALYRDLTEMHSFYHCDTIGNLVTEQYCRDLKGTIVSFFDENSCLGKKYVFDIQRTLRETYDSTRRVIYSSEVHPSSPDGNENQQSSVINNKSTFHHQHESSFTSCVPTCQALKQLCEMHENLACHICADADINTAFVPCGHIVCCTACANRLDCCPVCKCSIDLAQPVYLPYARPAFKMESHRAVTCA